MNINCEFFRPCPQGGWCLQLTANKHERMSCVLLTGKTDCVMRRMKEVKSQHEAGNEICVKLSNGNEIRSSSADLMGGEYVRIVNSRGKEIGYWHFEEWKEDPVTVMGAILMCANKTED